MYLPLSTLPSDPIIPFTPPPHMQYHVSLLYKLSFHITTALEPNPASRHRPVIGLVSIYFATVFWIQLT